MKTLIAILGAGSMLAVGERPAVADKKPDKKPNATVRTQGDVHVKHRQHRHQPRWRHHHYYYQPYYVPSYRHYYYNHGYYDSWGRWHYRTRPRYRSRGLIINRNGLRLWRGRSGIRIGW